MCVCSMFDADNQRNNKLTDTFQTRKYTIHKSNDDFKIIFW